MNELIKVDGIDFKEKDGTLYIRLEAAAIGYGWCRKEVKNGVEYSYVRWERVFSMLDEIGFAHKWAKDGFIPEEVFYKLGMRAKNETAKAFQDKVAAILKKIRQTGAYIAPQSTDEDSDDLAIINGYKALMRKVERLEAKAAIDAPKVEFYDQVADCVNCIYMADLAKLLSQNGFKIGRDKLFELMRNEGFLLKAPGQWNKPSQYAMNLGLFKVIEKVVNKGGVKEVKSTTMVTPKGIKYFLNRYLVDKLAGQAIEAPKQLSMLEEA